MKEKEKIEADADSLNFPDLSHLDISKHCPKYVSVLQRKDGETIAVEDLELLQFELEKMLVSLVKRQEQIETYKPEKFREKKLKKSKGSSLESQEKRSLIAEEKPSKKFKDSSGKQHAASTSPRPKSKNLQLAKAQAQENEFKDTYVDVPKIQKNDGPSRFWSFIEPYCAEISQEDVKAVEDWMKTHETDSEYLQIPPLGDHFASQWPQEDFLEEMKEGSKTVSSNDSVIDPSEVKSLWENAKAECASFHDSQISSLTERLVTALVDENLMTALDDTMTDACREDDNVSATVQANLTKLANQANDASLEERVRKELVDLGLLEADDTEMDNVYDELLLELKKLQSNLVPVCDHNLNQKKRLLSMAKSEIAKQEVRKKLQEADAKVMEMYRSFAAAKLKGRKLNKKEQDQVLTVLQERNKLMNQLETMS